MFEVLINSDKKIPLDEYRDLMLAQFDLDDLIMSTTCYYLGRRTAAVSWFCDSLTNAWPNLRASTAKFVIRVVDEAFDRYARGQKNALGHDCDREKWTQVRTLWIGEAR